MIKFCYKVARQHRFWHGNFIFTRPQRKWPCFAFDDLFNIIEKIFPKFQLEWTDCDWGANSNHRFFQSRRQKNYESHLHKQYQRYITNVIKWPVINFFYIYGFLRYLSFWCVLLSIAFKLCTGFGFYPPWNFASCLTSIFILLIRKLDL